MLGFIRAMNDATSLSVSERFMSAAIFRSCSGVGRETGMAFSCSGGALRALARRARCGGRGDVLRVEMAGGEVAGAHLAERGLDVAADVADVRLAARVEPAARGRVERARDLAAQDDLLALPLHVGIGRRNGR